MENASLYPLKCGFCGHANPADSRYCNACGAPFSVQPCPRCGTTNEATALICQECGAPLADGGPSDFFLPLPSEAAVLARSTHHVAEVTADAVPPGRTSTATESEMFDYRGPSIVAPPPESAVLGTASVAASRLRDVAVPLPPAEPVAPASPPQPTAVTPVSAPDPAPLPGDEEAAQAAPPASSESALFQATPKSSSQGRAFGWVAVLAAAGVAVYFAYGYFQRFQAGDTAPRPAATDKPTAGSTGATTADTGKPAAAGASPPAVPAGAGGNGGRGVDPSGAGSARPQAPTDIFVAKPEPDPRRAAPQPQEAAKAAAAGTQGEIRRPAGGSAVGAAPPSPGACSDAVAALGLCTQENTKGRKP